MRIYIDFPFTSFMSPLLISATKYKAKMEAHDKLDDNAKNAMKKM